MKNTLSFLFLLTLNLVFAQTPNWTWAKNISVYFNSKQDMTAVDPAGNVYLIGDFNVATATIGGTTFTNASEAGNADAYILKFNSTGTLLWSKQITGAKNESISSIDTDNLGNIYICGAFQNTVTLGSTTLTTSPLGGTTFMAKLNSNGNYLWAIKNSGVNEVYSIVDIKSDNVGNLFITGSSRSQTLTFGSVQLSLPSGDPTINHQRTYIAKFDTNGICQWAKMGTSTQSQATFGSYSISVAADNNGGAAICGQFANNTMDFGSITLTKTTQNNNAINMFIAKYDSSGNEMWAYNAGSAYENFTQGSCVTIDSNGNVFVAGSFPNTVQFGTTTINSVTGSQLYLAKYSAAGTLIWVKTTAYNTNGFTTLRSLATDANGNIYGAGSADATTINFTNNITLSGLGTAGAFFVTKWNSSGIPIYAKAVTGTNPNNILSIDCNAEDDLFVGGTFGESTLQIGNTLLTKAGPNYDLFIGRLTVVPLSNSNFNVNSISVYPNPASEVVNITNLKTNYSYSLYNILGDCVKQGLLFTERETIDVNSLQAGLYVMQLTDSAGNKSQKKILIE